MKNANVTKTKSKKLMSADKTPGGKVGDDQRDAIKNEFLSGYYVVSGMKYKWTSPGPISMEMTLLRREWPIPAKNKNN